MTNPANLIDVSVIIPTVNRPTMLSRAIKSCLTPGHSVSMEVVVVPNGPSDSWKIVCSQFSTDPRVRFAPSASADQNIARNLGLELARGTMVRFLDDDDYLFPDAVEAQFQFMLEHKLDFCSGNAVLADKDNVSLGQLVQPTTCFPEIAALSARRLQLPFTHLYRRDSVGDLRWPVGMKQSEDIVWLINYVIAAPRRWERFDDVVGAWYQHSGARQSLDRPSGKVHEATAEVLLEAESTLKAQGRWTGDIALAVAGALWEITHRAFPFRPVYWTTVATRAMRICRAARPSAPLYGYPFLRAVDPRMLMWMLLPKRLASLAYLYLRGTMAGRDYRRTL